jgi:hypothetical protein
VKRLITEELKLRRVSFKWVSHTLTACQKLERVKISRKLFEQLNKFQVNDLARVITGHETCLYFENLRSAMWAGADLICSTPSKQPIGAKKVMF